MQIRINEQNINTKKYFEDYYSREEWRIDWDGADKRLKEAVGLMDERFETHLDIGCADGTFTKLYLKKFPDTKGYGIDISEVICQQAQKNCPEGIFQAADCYHLPFEDEKFNMVHCAEVIEHLEFPEQAIMEMYRVLKPKGKLIITTPNEKAEEYKEHLWKWDNRGVRLLIESKMDKTKLQGFNVIEEHSSFHNGHVMYLVAQKV